MTETEKRTIELAEVILKAPKAWIEAEPPECLAEILETVIRDLRPIKILGNAWRIINLEIMLEKIPRERELFEKTVDRVDNPGPQMSTAHERRIREAL